MKIFEEKEKGFEEGANYCTFFPDTAFGVNYSYACYLHDREYRNERKTRLTRKEADKQLQQGVYYYFKKANKPILGFLWALIMYLGVSSWLFKKYWIVEPINANSDKLKGGVK